uniref:Putative IQ domain-containing protein K-like protein n=1 Tax=Pinctada fucata TaxID=50426 RepID=A0A194AMR7_PINFU
MHQYMEIDEDVMKDVDTSISHPSCVGYAFAEKPPDTPPPPPTPPPPKDKCSPREYLEHYVFPWLLPALEDMLRQAKKEKCLERKRTAFNALDYITEHLYRNNPKYSDRGDIKFEKIPFVQKHWETHPRAPLPLSLIWTEEEAAIVIQSHFRGYLVRREPDIQELRQWQKEWREENQGIKTQVSAFWDKKMPDWNQPTPSVSQDNIVNESKKDDEQKETVVTDSVDNKPETTETKPENSEQTS